MHCMASATLCQREHGRTVKVEKGPWSNLRQSYSLMMPLSMPTQNTRPCRGHAHDRNHISNKQAMKRLTPVLPAWSANAKVATPRAVGGAWCA